MAERSQRAEEPMIVAGIVMWKMSAAQKNLAES